MRVVLRPEEREAVRGRLEALGIHFAEERGALRLVGGRCVVWEEGCRLHAAFGAAAKPRVCQQFPRVGAGEEVGVDPACAHGHRFVAGPVALAASSPGTLLPDGLEAQGAALGVDLVTLRARWGALPWRAWAEPVSIGPQRRQILEELSALVAPTSWPVWTEGARAVQRGARLRLGGHAEDWLLGAVVIGAADVDDGLRRRWFAGWVRAIRS